MPQKTKKHSYDGTIFKHQGTIPRCFLFYRLGDFYELFNEDAIKAAQILELTLTSRNKMRKNRSQCAESLIMRRQ